MAKQAIRTLGKIPGMDRLLWHGGQYLEDTGSDYLSPAWQAARVNGHFTNSDGEMIPLIRGLRDKIKPGWQAMVTPSAGATVPGAAEVARRMDYWRNKYRRVDAFLDTFGISIAGKDVLEVGAYDGVTSYTLAGAGAGSVTGIDIAAYYIRQTPDEEVNQQSLESKNAELEAVRNAYRDAAGRTPGERVRFIEDDICTSTMASDSLDMVFSWEVMEHVTDPASAFAEMYRMLRPGGVVFHEYNPFFSIDGGHSLCTLDFLWGHARLSDEDFSRYLDENRPDEKELALSFYRNNLNRMTLSGLVRYIAEAGFSMLSVLPWPRRKYLELLDRGTLAQCVRVYPEATVTDLVSPVVWILSQKRISISEPVHYRNEACVK